MGDTGEVSWVKPPAGTRINLPDGTPAPSANHRLPRDPSRLKTELCRNWDTAAGCKYKDKCNFAHGYEELKSAPGAENNTGTFYFSAEKGGYMMNANMKTSMCKNWDSLGKCPYGEICCFAHGLEELREKPRDLVTVPASIVGDFGTREDQEAHELAY